MAALKKLIQNIYQTELVMYVETHFMPRTGFDFQRVVEPCYIGHGLGLDAALKDEPLAVVLLPDGRLASERRRLSVHLSEIL